LRDRIPSPQPFRARERRGYFTDPKLFWYVANNPNLIERMPANITDIASAMIARGVDRADLDYTLGLVMSSGPALEEGHQVPLARLILAAGARLTSDAINVAAGHGMLDVLRALLADGHPITAPIAAAIGDEDALRGCIATAAPEEIQTAFGLAAINKQHQSVRIALDAGADINAFLPVHSHSTALHTAAVNDDVALIELLLERGARTDIRDTLWDSTPLDWAVHEHRAAAQAALERLSA